MVNSIADYILGKLAAHCERNNQVLIVDAQTTFAQLNLDSLSLIEAVFDLEEEFGINLDGVDLQALEQVSDLIVAVNRARADLA